ncbi:MAG TPA: anthranilate synthase component I family protein [Bacteroidetes bacterium]|nr:anthranilate synthase component I family protein [Bacteroidota bacterium]
MKEYAFQTRYRVLPADLQTPVGIYLKVRDLYPQSVLLESSDYHTTQNSFSFIGVEPIASFTLSGGHILRTYPDGTRDVRPVEDDTDVPAELSAYIRQFSAQDNPTGINGFFGYTAYDAVRYFEKVKIRPAEGDFAHLPDIVQVLFRFVIVVNHFKNTLTIVENLLPSQTSRMDELKAVLDNQNVAQYPFQAAGAVESSVSDEQYMEMVRRGIRHTLRGDVFQIVPSRRFSRAFYGDEFNVYRALRSINPSPYLFYFDFGSMRIFGSSPETHLRVSGDRAYIDPIAGTFRRTGNDEADRALADRLLSDEKENAEHVMLVDLARNDLGRNCTDVRVEFFRQVQFYSHVIHMVSRVSAHVPEGTDPIRLLADTFPAGTLSGAPKVRAIQLIDEMEPHPRGLYGGCIGYIGLDGSLNQAITIRSFLSLGQRLYCQGGAGIVAHSDPRSELSEVNNKLGALMAAVDRAEEYAK